jgi:hypothetical protein
MGAAAPVFLASFSPLSLVTYVLRTEEKFYETVSTSSSIGQYIEDHIIFDATQNGIAVA